MLSKFAAKGRSGSGATIRAAVQIFEERTSGALDTVLAEAAKLIEHRGKAWTAAMAGIGDALQQHLSRAREVVSGPIRVGNRGGSPDDAASQATDGLISDARERLTERLADFRDGWTAPVPKHWKDRHPFWYAVGLLVIGAIIGAIAKTAI
jgi:hypothetical protein